MGIETTTETDLEKIKTMLMKQAGQLATDDIIKDVDPVLMTTKFKIDIGGEQLELSESLIENLNRRN